MRAKDFITEAASTNLLIVDVQPEYAQWSNPILPGIQNMIAKSTGRVVIVFNDFGGGDTAEAVYHYLAGHDEEYDGYVYNDETDDYEPAELTPLEEKLQNAEYKQKEFGFLRSMMDMGVSDRVIIHILREMYMQKVNDSRDLELASLPEEIQQEISNIGFDWDSDGIFIQDWVPAGMLKQLSPFYMMGGGRTECLREIELICNAFNIRYKRIDQLIY